MTTFCLFQSSVFENFPAAEEVNGRAGETPERHHMQACTNNNNISTFTRLDYPRGSLVRSPLSGGGSVQ